MISSLLTDFYQLTMACGYWKLGMHERETVFHLIFRKHPFHGNYAVTAGLATAIEFLNNWRFTDEDLNYLHGLRAVDETALFPPEFLNYLKSIRFSCDVDAIPEGTLAFPHEPIIRIKGPIIQGQLIESALLNIINFQTLIATKASRVCLAAKGDPVFEFGLRRAQGPDGALSASRAAYIGGCIATSNVLAGKLYDIPLRGTHAHSWVTAFPDEMTAFAAYAKVMPNNCTLLVDTYDTLLGVKHAIEIGRELRKQGKDLLGVRLDSGDIATLSIQTRKLLDEAGFQQTKIIASNSLDEYVVQQMKEKGAKIDIWGVGTHLATAYDHPALDGVYKLSAIRDEQGNWIYKLKLSEQIVKISNPGIHQVRRFLVNGNPIMDLMYDVESTDVNSIDSSELITLEAPHFKHAIPKHDQFVDLLVPVFRKGKCVYPKESIHAIRERAQKAVSQFVAAHDGKPYLVGLDKKLHELKQALIAKVG